MIMHTDPVAIPAVAEFLEKYDREETFPILWAGCEDIEQYDHLSSRDVQDSGDEWRTIPLIDLSHVARGNHTAGQSTSIQRSNFRSLQRLPFPWVRVRYQTCEVLTIPVTALVTTDGFVAARELWQTLIGLADGDGGTFDEEDLCELEYDDVLECWDSFGKSDALSEIRADDACSDVDIAVELASLVSDHLSEDIPQGAYGTFWTHNGYESASFDYDAIADQVEPKLQTWHAELHREKFTRCRIS